MCHRRHGNLGESLHFQKVTLLQYCMMKTVHHKGTGLLDSREQTSEYARTTKRLWDQTARPGPGSHTPHPAPQCPRQQVGAAAATRPTRSEHAALLVWGWAWKDHRAQAQVPQDSGRPDGSTFPDRNHCSPRKVAASEGLSFPQAPSAVPETQSPTPRPVGLPRPRLPEPHQPPLSAARLSARSGP